MSHHDLFFQDGRFTPTTIDLRMDDDPELPWEKAMDQLGWDSIGAFPYHEHADYSSYRADCWRRRDSHLCLAELWRNGELLSFILCADMGQMLLLQRDFILPLVAGANTDTVIDELLKATHCLFDRQYGLQCAQRVLKNDEYQVGLAWERRQAARKAKEGNVNAT